MGFAHTLREPPWVQGLKKLPGLVCRWQEPLARHTTFGVGGPVTCLAQPQSETALAGLVRWLRREGVAHFILGGGSNLLAADEPMAAVAIQLDACCRDIRVESTAPPRWDVGCGVRLARLLRHCLQQACGGLEFLVGIPGSVGGALVMNAGTAAGTIGDRLVSVTLLDHDVEERRVDRAALAIGYRFIDFPRDAVLLRAVIAVVERPPAEMRREMGAIMRRRRATQPLGWPSAGCVFKNPPGQSAGALIDRAGLKGHRCGDAEFSERHANWIVNRGRATAHDVLALVALAEARVYSKFGVRLEREIRVLGP
jgi:UDP-N-acetylmuramate dehydrogenase